MNWCCIVKIKNLSDENAQEIITSVFVNKEDADQFIEDFKNDGIGSDQSAWVYLYRLNFKKSLPIGV